MIINKRKILLVGPFPPPYGGISVQIQRIRDILLESDDFDCQIINIGEKRDVLIPGSVSVNGYIDYILKLIYFLRDGYHVHIITNGHNFKSWISCLACVALSLLFNRKAIVTLGSGLLPKYIEKSNVILSVIIYLVLRYSSVVVCRNIYSKEALLRSCKRSDVRIVPGFLGVNKKDIGILPDSLEQFRYNNTPLIVSHATAEPEYGTYLLIRSCLRLINKFPNMGVIVIGMDIMDLNQMAIPHKFKDKFIFTGYTPHSTALAVIKSADVFVRSSVFDGDSNSVRESIALGTSVVASDTDFRPEGVNLFAVGNEDELVAKVTQILEEGDTILTREIICKAREGNLSLLLNIYNEYIRTR